MSNTVADYQTYANLQMLAEAIKIEVGAIPVGTGSWADVGNDRSSKTPLEIAKQMNAQGWTVAAHLRNTPTGHLVTAFEQMHCSEVAQAYTFNGAGVGTVNQGSTLQDVIAKFNEYRPADKDAGQLCHGRRPDPCAIDSLTPRYLQSGRSCK